jgi:hypothetical protein
VTNRVATRVGLTGYLDQLARTRRFLKRFETQPRTFTEFEEEVQDNALAFFQNCHHITDWMRFDPAVTDAQRELVESEVAHSHVLKICRDVACAAKHLKLDRPKSGTGASAAHLIVNIYEREGDEVMDEADLALEDGHGNTISGLDLGRQCILEWERILGLASLPISRG